MRRHFLPYLTALVIAFASAFPALAQNAAPNRTPKAEDFAALARLPAMSGIWLPDIKDQIEQEHGNQPPWTAKAKAKIDAMIKDENAGKPHPLFVNCLPQGTPTWMAITHNAIEILLTPGRITVMGELDGNAMRRIHTDGRAHPQDPDPSFAGHSIGRWEGDALVVDTVAIHPQVYLAISEGAGVPNNGDMRVIERWRLSGPNVLLVDMEVTAPHILTGTWKTTRKFFRDPNPAAEIVGGVCLEGNYAPVKDANGDSVFVPRKYSFSE